MEEVLDVIFSRILFAGFICFIIFIYKYAHVFLYPRGTKQISNSFNIFDNPADTLHYLSRIIGITIILSQIKFDRFFSIALNSMNIFNVAIVSIFLYLISVLISDTVILGKYNYFDEILKKKNFSYALVTFSKNIGLALLIQKVYTNSQNSFIIYLILWTYLNVVFLLMTKAFQIFSHFPFHKMILKKNIGMSISFFGYTLGNTILFYQAFDADNIDIYSYMTRVFLKVFLSILFIPFFIYFFRWLLPYRDKESLKEKSLFFDFDKSLALGIFEGSVYLATCLLTSWVIYKINLSGILSNY